MQPHPEESVMATIGHLVTDPEHWAERAKDIRMSAGSLHDPDAKARMLKIADGYEVLRRRTEERRRAGW